MNDLETNYFDSKLRILNLIEKELIEIWEMLSSMEKRNEKQYQRFLTTQRAARNFNEAFVAFASSQGYFNSRGKNDRKF